MNIQSKIAPLTQYYPLYQQLVERMGILHALVSLIARGYLANVFFSAGLTKVQDWDTTLFLFQEEYQVPFLPAEIAAFLGTAGELIFPVLLIIGLTSRFSALALSVVNIVAVISLSEIAAAALYLHVIWGVLLAYIVLHGAGLISIDAWLKRAIQKHSEEETDKQ